MITKSNPQFNFSYDEEVIQKNICKTLGQFFGFKTRFLLLTSNKLVLFEDQNKYEFKKEPKVITITNT